MATVNIVVPVRMDVEVDYDHMLGILTLTMPEDVTTAGYHQAARFGRVLGYEHDFAPTDHVYIADCLGDNDNLPSIAGFLEKAGVIEIVDADVRPRLSNSEQVALARVLI